MITAALMTGAAFLQRDERIQAHFMTCFLALIVYRYLEVRTGNSYTAGA